jgi:hypothetical protein
MAAARTRKRWEQSMSRERGLVISVPIKAEGGALTVPHRPQGGGLDLQELRFSLLFWDKLDFPSNNQILVGLDDEGRFLQNAGVLHRTHIRLAGDLDTDFAAAVYVQAHLAAFKELDKKEPGVWSLATGENAISFSESELEPARGVLVSLHRAVPVPDKDVPLEDILSFRTKRRDELIALRHHLEDIYQRVIVAGDGELALTTEIERLEIAINNHLKACRETGLKFKLADIDASLNLLGPLGAATIAYALGLPALASLAAGAAAALKLSVGPSLKRREAISTPFKYVSSYHHEVF